jgi:hypothetical protein
MIQKQETTNQQHIAVITSIVQKRIAGFNSDINKIANTMRFRGQTFFNSLKARTTDATVLNAISENEQKYTTFIQTGLTALNGVVSELTSDLSLYLPVLTKTFAANSIISTYFGNDFQSTLASQTNEQVFNCLSNLASNVQILLDGNTDRVLSCAIKQGMLANDRITTYSALVQSLVSTVFANEQNMVNNLNKCISETGLIRNLMLTNCAPMVSDTILITE